MENKVENVRYQYDDVCNDGEKSVNKYVCTECSVQSTECGCEGSDAIGQEQTNQEAGLRFSANRSFTQPKGGTSIIVGRGAQASRSSTFGNNSYQGRGDRVTFPAVFSKVYTPSKQMKMKQNTHFNGKSESLTPTKRRLIQNSNTRTMLRMFP